MMYGYLYGDLSEWIAVHAGRLHRVGKGELADAFDDFVTAYFGGDDVQALRLLPIVRELARAMNEPLWGYVIAYYDALITIYWLGDLKTGLRRATGAYCRASRDPRAELISLYLAEVIGFGWLDVDGRAFSYMQEFLSALNMRRPGFPEDVRKRLQLLYHYGWAMLAPGDAASTIRPFVEQFEGEWPRPYLDAVYGQTYLWQERYEVGERYLNKALTGFEGHNLRYDANEVRLKLAGVYHERGEFQRLRDFATDLVERTDALRNKAHQAAARVLLGRAVDHFQITEDALPIYLQAQGLYEGLGWERAEGNLALDVAHICLEWESINMPDPACTGKEAYTERLLSRMTSNDLYIYFQQLREMYKNR